MKLIRTVASTVLLTLAVLVSNVALAIAAPAVVEDIRDIRAPLPIPPWWHWPLAIASAVLVVTAVVLLLRYWYKRRHRPLTPLERARQDLDLAEKLARMIRPHDWAEMVAATMRGALAVRIGENVLPQTTSELAKAPWANVLVVGEPDAVRDPGTPYLLEAPQLLALLEICDLARFARASLDMDAMLAATSSARELLERLFAPQLPNPESVAEAALLPDSEPVPITLRTGAEPKTPSQHFEQASR